MTSQPDATEGVRDRRTKVVVALIGLVGVLAAAWLSRPSRSQGVPVSPPSSAEQAPDRPTGVPGGSLPSSPVAGAETGRQLGDGVPNPAAFRVDSLGRLFLPESLETDVYRRFDDIPPLQRRDIEKATIWGRWIRLRGEVQDVSIHDGKVFLVLGQGRGGFVLEFPGTMRSAFLSVRAGDTAIANARIDSIGPIGLRYSQAELLAIVPRQR